MAPVLKLPEDTCTCLLRGLFVPTELQLRQKRLPNECNEAECEEELISALKIDGNFLGASEDFSDGFKSWRQIEDQVHESK